jgi:hypothetical protein
MEDRITSHLDPHDLAVTRMVEEQERQGLEAMLNGWVPPARGRSRTQPEDCSA